MCNLVRPAAALARSAHRLSIMLDCATMPTGTITGRTQYGIPLAARAGRALLTAASRFDKCTKRGLSGICTYPGCINPSTSDGLCHNPCSDGGG